MHFQALCILWWFELYHFKTANSVFKLADRYLKCYFCRLCTGPCLLLWYRLYIVCIHPVFWAGQIHWTNILNILCAFTSAKCKNTYIRLIDDSKVDWHFVIMPKPFGSCIKNIAPLHFGLNLEVACLNFHIYLKSSSDLVSYCVVLFKS